MVSSEDKNVSAGKKPKHYLNRKGSLTVNILDFSAAFLAFVSFCLMRVITFHPIRIKLCNSPRPKNQFHCQGNTLSSPLHGRGGGAGGKGRGMLEPQVLTIYQVITAQCCCCADGGPEVLVTRL
jgi:hypothetical protein